MKKAVESVDSSNPIQYLYKYMSLDGFQKMISENTLLFSDPTEYNDPFDTKGYINCESLLEERMKFWIKEGKSINEAQQMANVPCEILENFANQAYDHIRKHLRICCFSKLNNNILMWSHYADKHKGICVKFDSNKDTIFSSAKLVDYKSDLPVLHIFKNDLNEISNMIYSKSIDWKYEEEVRITKHIIQDTKKKVAFKKQALTEVILGCNFPDDQLKKIKTLIEKKGYNVILKKAVVLQNQYRISITNINI